MRVGIMSMQRIMNYGSFLQAYGLMNMVRQLGNDVEFVDYHPGKCVVNNTTQRRLMDYIKLVVNYFLHRNTASKRAMYRTARLFPQRYEEMLKSIGVTNERRYAKEMDVLIIGSDEVFNCLQDNPEVGFAPELFGKNVQAKRCISFSASFGSTTLDKLRKYDKETEIAQYLQEMDAISVRDNNSEEIVRCLTGKPASVNLDPVLLYDFEKEIPVIEDKNYIVVYSYRGRISKEEGKRIRAFAKKNNKKLIALGGVLDFCDEHIVCDAFTVMAYVKYADYVITDTFHGTVFSIKYGKKFISIIRDSNKEKLGDLLQRFNLMDRCIYDITQLECALIESEPISQRKINEIIANEQQKAFEYLRRNII